LSVDVKKALSDDTDTAGTFASAALKLMEVSSKQSYSSQA